MNILTKINREKRVYFIIAGLIFSLLPCWFFYNIFSNSALFIYLLSFCFILTPLNIILLRNIKCPRCNHRLVWDYFNDSKKFPKEYSPFKSGNCPNCGFDPEYSGE